MGAGAVSSTGKLELRTTTALATSPCPLLSSYYLDNREEYRVDNLKSKSCYLELLLTQLRNLNLFWIFLLIHHEPLP